MFYLPLSFSQFYHFPSSIFSFPPPQFYCFPSTTTTTTTTTTTATTFLLFSLHHHHHHISIVFPPPPPPPPTPHFYCFPSTTTTTATTFLLFPSTYDVIGVNLFLRTLMRFLRKKRLIRCALYYSVGRSQRSGFESQ